jgi:hypothetical protein
MKIYPFKCDESTNWQVVDTCSKPFTSYRKLANTLKPGEKVRVRVTEPSFIKGQEMLAGYGEVSLSADGKTFSYPRRLQHEF